MSQNNQDPANKDDPKPTQDPANLISPEELKKLQDQKAELENNFNTMKSQMEAIKNEKLKAEGNKDDYIKNIEKQLADEKAARETEANKYKLTKVVSQFREMAAKEGVKHLDDLQKLYGDQLRTVKVNANFEIEGDGLKHIFSGAKEKSPYLFNSPAPKVDDLNHIKTKVQQDSYVEELKAVKSQKELDALRKRHNRS